MLPRWQTASWLSAMIYELRPLIASCTGGHLSASCITHRPAPLNQPRQHDNRPHLRKRCPSLNLATGEVQLQIAILLFTASSIFRQATTGVTEGRRRNPASVSFVRQVREFLLTKKVDLRERAPCAINNPTNGNGALSASVQWEPPLQRERANGRSAYRGSIGHFVEGRTKDGGVVGWLSARFKWSVPSSYHLNDHVRHGEIDAGQGHGRRQEDHR